MSTEATLAGDGSYLTSEPNLEGVIVEVQHSIKSGKGLTKDPGTVGFGVIILPSGQPRVILQAKHSDGTCLAATFDRIGLATLLECGADAYNEALRISMAADLAKAKAQ